MGGTRGDKIHELRNMLSIVLNYSLVLEKGIDKDDAMATDLAELKTAARRALEITKALSSDDDVLPS